MSPQRVTYLKVRNKILQGSQTPSERLHFGSTLYPKFKSNKIHIKTLLIYVAKLIGTALVLLMQMINNLESFDIQGPRQGFGTAGAKKFSTRG